MKPGFPAPRRVSTIGSNRALTSEPRVSIQTDLNSLNLQRLVLRLVLGRKRSQANAGMENDLEPVAISISDTIKALSLGRTKIYELINEGRLSSFKVGRRTLVKVDSIHALVNIRD